MPNFKVLSHFRLRKWLSKVKKRVLTPSFSHLTFSSQMGTLSTQWTLFQSFSIVKFASGPYASTLIFKLRLKVLSTQKSTKGKGGPRGLNEPGLQKETIIYYISYIFFVFMVVGARSQEFTFFLVCEWSIIYKIFDIFFFVSPFLSINWGKNIFISAYPVRKIFFFCVILREIFLMSVWSNVLFNQNRLHSQCSRIY